MPVIPVVVLAGQLIGRWCGIRMRGWKAHLTGLAEAGAASGLQTPPQSHARNRPARLAATFPDQYGNGCSLCSRSMALVRSEGSVRSNPAIRWRNCPISVAPMIGTVLNGRVNCHATAM